MRLKKGDKVIMRVGKDKGKTGVITKLLPRSEQVIVDGLNIVKRAYKPTQANPRGGIKDEPRPIPVAKVAIIHPASDKRGSRIAYKLNKDGSKTRVYVQGGRKEIKG